MLQISLPDVEDFEPLEERCFICGGNSGDADSIHEHEFQAPDGPWSMSVDRDLCLLCAIWLSRGLKARYGKQARMQAIALISCAYPEVWIEANIQ